MFIPCLDTKTQDLLVRIPEICDFIHQMRHGEEKHNVLVHYHKGISRSATVILAYLMRSYRQPLDAVLASVKAIRRVRPNSNFMEQLAVWAEVEYEIWEDEVKTVPKPPYAAYLVKRAERLAAKGLTGDEPTYPAGFTKPPPPPPDAPLYYKYV
jgi:dual specificity phosphatase 12